MTPVVPPIAAHRNSMEMSMSERAPGCISASSNFYLAQKNIPSLLDRNRRSSRIPISSSVSRTFLSERNARNTFSRRYTLTESGLDIRIVSLRESSRLWAFFRGGRREMELFEWRERRNRSALGPWSDYLNPRGKEKGKEGGSGGGVI